MKTYIHKNLVILKWICIYLMCGSILCIACNQPQNIHKETKAIIEQKLIPKGTSKIIFTLKENQYQGYEFADDAGNVLTAPTQVARRVTLNDAGKTSCYECPDSVNPAKDGFGKCKSITCCGPGISCGPLSTVLTVEQPSGKEPLVRSVQFVVEKME